jgi:DNA-binding XRE family transcriptional regulator
MSWRQLETGIPGLLREKVNNMAREAKHSRLQEGEHDYQEWKASLVDTPQKRALYQEIAEKSDLWLQLVEARQAAGLTQRDLAERLGVSQAQVARIEKRGYDSYTLNTLRRYVQALGGDFSLEVRVRQPHERKQLASAAPAS